MESVDKRIVAELERIGRKVFQAHQIPETHFAVKVFADYLETNRQWLSEEMTYEQTIEYFDQAGQHVKFVIDNMPKASTPWKG